MKELTIDEVIRMYEESIQSEAKEGSLVGRVMRFQIADSYGFYIITKEEKDYVMLEKLKIQDFENYTEDIIGEEGLMNKSRAISHINLDYRLNKLFKK
jgi:hypothetical protein